MFDLLKMFHPGDKEKIAEILRIDTLVLEKFEEEYRKAVIREDEGRIRNAKQASAAVRENVTIPEDIDESAMKDVMHRIVEELLSRTEILEVKDGVCRTFRPEFEEVTPVTNDELRSIPEFIRPQLTGSLMKVDINGDSTGNVMTFYKAAMEAKNRKLRSELMMHFLQGVSILDLDYILYRILGMNRNSIGYWLPAVTEAVSKQRFFKIPDTRVAKVPVPLLQLSRLEYLSLTPSTLKIVDDWAMKAFGLDREKDYFIKTGVFSSKFDFRNAKITAGREVEELGEYLLFIAFQASQMAGGIHFDGNELFKAPVMIGPALTNEWVVREYIRDTEGNTEIYHGLPLHTEYRVFVDFGMKEVLGMSPYWRSDIMKERFSKREDADTPDMQHDYITYTAQEPVLNKRYEENGWKVLEGVRRMLPHVKLTGQWSIDIMQNGDDFWLIDMAVASQSALSDCIPEGKLIPGHITEENWIPEFTEIPQEAEEKPQFYSL